MWLPTPEGLIVIDAGRNVSGGRRAVAAMKGTGLPVLAVLITHPHPDHVGGLGVLHEAFPQAPIYASEATTAWMRTDPLDFYPLARQFDPDYPTTLTYPDATFGPNKSLTIGSVQLDTAEFGPGESATATAYFEPTTRSLFAGDLVSNHFTPALLEGHTEGWLKNLDILANRFPQAGLLYPGHGVPADAKELIEGQHYYLEEFRDLVEPAVARNSSGGTAISSTERESILTELGDEYPDYPRVASLPTLDQVNVDAVGRELRRERSTAR